MSTWSYKIPLALSNFTLLIFQQAALFSNTLGPFTESKHKLSKWRNSSIKKFNTQHQDSRTYQSALILEIHPITFLPILLCIFHVDEPQFTEDSIINHRILHRHLLFILHKTKKITFLKGVLFKILTMN